MPDSTLNAPTYRNRMRTTIYGARLGLDDDGMLIGAPALKKLVTSLTTVPTTMPAHGVGVLTATGSTQGPVQHNLAAPMVGVEVELYLISTSTGSQQILTTPNGASIVATSLGTTVGVINFVGPGGSITLEGLTTSKWGIKSIQDVNSTGLARSITFTTST